ncbi:MAG: thioredoxin [Simkaniaceae bacterium]|nr:thioredoxin [Simkaniaceae bacterium]
MVKVISDSEFDQEVKNGVVLVDFYADWCGPCRMMAPVLDELAHEMEGDVSFVKVDIDKSSKAAGALQITSIPTLVLFKNGAEVARCVGLKDLDALRDFVEGVL